MKDTTTRKYSTKKSPLGSWYLCSCRIETASQGLLHHDATETKTPNYMSFTRDFHEEIKRFGAILNPDMIDTFVVPQNPTSVVSLDRVGSGRLIKHCGPADPTQREHDEAQHIGPNRHN